VFEIASDARVLNQLANHPDVLPFIGPSLDEVAFDARFTAEWITRTKFFHNVEETVGMLFDWTMPGAWELHMLATPEARGGDALEFAIEIIAHMFASGVETIWGQTPIWNERARKMHSKVGGISRGFGTHPAMGEVEIFATRHDEWEPRRPKYEQMKNNSSEVA